MQLQNGKLPGNVKIDSEGILSIPCKMDNFNFILQFKKEKQALIMNGLERSRIVKLLQIDAALKC